jgi:PAS domain-containing protein
MGFQDLIAALLLSLPPWLGFWIFRWKGRVGLSYGYFLGGILAVLALPWPRLSGHPVPTALLGAALFGFTLFLQAQREGVQGLRRLAVGVGGATLFELLLLLQLGLPWRTIPRFWAGAVLEALFWLLLSDLAYRWTRGRLLELRMPLVGAGALGLGALAQAALPPDTPRLPWPAALAGGLLLGLVAVQQLRWLEDQGAWVEGRGQGLRTALALLDQHREPEAPGLAFGLDPRQAQWLVDEKGRVLESNGPFSRLVGLPRHRLRGYAMDALFQGGESPVWDSLRTQLLQRGHGTAPATQVSDDGAFREVQLEAVAFDRGMALLWIADPAEGTLSLRPEGGFLRPLGGEAEHRRTLNALAALLPSAELVLAEAPPGEVREAAARVREAARRLGPGGPMDPAEPLDGAGALAILEPRFRTMLPVSIRLTLDAAPVPLALGQDALRRVATLLLLHAAERTPGEVRLVLEAVALGGRPWALLSARPVGEGGRLPRELQGLGWLRAEVQGVRGLLDLEQDVHGGLLPRVYLPCAAPDSAPPAGALAGRRVWVVDRDPLLRDALAALIRRWGGEASVFEDLATLLRTSRDAVAPDALLVERTAQLERFHGALRKFQREPIPTLVMGEGQVLPLDPSGLGLRRLGFVEKPLPEVELLHALLALMRPRSG